MDTLKASYDEYSDVLYLSLGEPVPSDSEDVGEGILVRYPHGSHSKRAITIVGFSEAWPKRLEGLAVRVARNLGVNAEESLKVLKDSLKKNT